MSRTPLLTGNWPRSVTSLSLQLPGPAMASRRTKQETASSRRAGTASEVKEEEFWGVPGREEGMGERNGKVGLWFRERRGKWRGKEPRAERVEEEGSRSFFGRRESKFG